MNFLKSLFLLSMMAFLSLPGMAEPKGWKVVYQYVLPAPELDLSGVPEEYRDQVVASYGGEDTEEEHFLYLRGDVSAYSTEQGAFGSKRFAVLGSNSVLINRKDKTMQSVRELDGKSYTVSGEYAPSEWRIEKETKMILGRTCTKATQQEGMITAWFCADLPIPAGPLVHYGLPGLVLELTVEKGYRLIATSLEALDRELEVVPPKGKVITSREFDEKLNAWLKSLNVEPSQKRGNVTVYRIEH